MDEGGFFIIIIIIIILFSFLFLGTADWRFCLSLSACPVGACLGFLQVVGVECVCVCEREGRGFFFFFFLSLSFFSFFRFVVVDGWMDQDWDWFETCMNLVG